MKRTWYVMALASTLVFAGQAQGVETRTAEKQPAMKSAADKGAALEPKLEALERKVWEGFKAQDMAAVKGVIASDAMSFDMNGLSTFAQFEPMMKDYTVESYTLSDFKVVPLGSQAAILLYNSTCNAKMKGQPMPTGPYYCSSTYVNRAGKWWAVFHQETLGATQASATEAK